MIRQALKAIAVFAVFTLSLMAVAPTPVADAGHCDAQRNQTFLGLPAWYKYLQFEHDSTNRCSPILGANTSENTEERVNSILPIGLAVLEGFVRLGGMIAVVFVFWGGMKYVLSQGSPEGTKAAKQTVINALIGLVIVIVAVNVVTFAGSSLF